MSIKECYDFFNSIKLNESDQQIAKRLINEICSRLSYLNDVGLGYLTLNRNSNSLSGGESQRVKLSAELSKVNTGRTLYILDEPTTGLHFQDVDMLISVLNNLVNKGNTVIVIEHNLDVVKCTDWVIDLGPEGGQGGGKIMAADSPENLIKVANSHTGKFLKKCL